MDIKILEHECLNCSKATYERLFDKDRVIIRCQEKFCLDFGTISISRFLNDKYSFIEPHVICNKWKRKDGRFLKFLLKKCKRALVSHIADKF